ncbi:ribonuclease H-like domain-containing protein [Nemania serpens]|nr:ribonuclease H-like domain-containing protein [Nemania serpens]
MAARFYPEQYVGRALDADESVEVPMVLAHLYDDEFHSFIVAVDGACRNNGQPGARAALGVFFRDDCRWNKSEMLPLRDTTSQRAELCAALRALETIDNFVAQEWTRSITTGKALKRVIVKSDSNYLVQGMTEWILKWLGNGFTTARSQPVENQDLIKELWELIKRMDQQKKIKVLFWKVAREDNADADRLANAALDAPRASTWDHQNSPTQLEEDKHASERVWRWHLRMGHLPLKDIQFAIPRVTGIDVTHEQIQAEIDKGASCETCARIQNDLGF